MRKKKRKIIFHVIFIKLIGINIPNRQVQTENTLLQITHISFELTHFEVFYLRGNGWRLHEDSNGVAPQFSVCSLIRGRLGKEKKFYVNQKGVDWKGLERLNDKVSV